MIYRWQHMVCFFRKSNFSFSLFHLLLLFFVISRWWKRHSWQKTEKKIWTHFFLFWCSFYCYFSFFPNLIQIISETDGNGSTWMWVQSFIVLAKVTEEENISENWIYIFLVYYDCGHYLDKSISTTGFFLINGWGKFAVKYKIVAACVFVYCVHVVFVFAQIKCHIRAFSSIRWKCEKNNRKINSFKTKKKKWNLFARDGAKQWKPMKFINNLGTWLMPWKCKTFHCSQYTRKHFYCFVFFPRNLYTCFVYCGCT